MAHSFAFMHPSLPMISISPEPSRSPESRTGTFTPSDFIWQGFMRGKKDGCEEWPVEGESLFSWHGEPLPYMPFVYQHPDYWHCIQKDTRGSGDFIRSRMIRG